MEDLVEVTENIPAGVANIGAVDGMSISLYDKAFHLDYAVVETTGNSRVAKIYVENLAAQEKDTFEKTQAAQALGITMVPEVAVSEPALVNH